MHNVITSKVKIYMMFPRTRYRRKNCADSHREMAVEYRVASQRHAHT